MHRVKGGALLLAASESAACTLESRWWIVIGNACDAPPGASIQRRHRRGDACVASTGSGAGKGGALLLVVQRAGSRYNWTTGCI